jgi:hypothetical protein
MTFADGGVVTAANEESLKAAIAAHVQPKGGETSAAGEGISYTYTTSAGVTVVVEEGKVNTDTSTAGADILSETQTSLDTYLASNPA